MATKITVEVSGLAALRRFLTPAEDFYGPPWKDGMDRIAAKTLSAGRSAAPHGTGKLQASLRTRVQKGGFPTWLAIDARATAAKRYPYPRLLEYSPKHHHTRWLQGALDKVWGNVAGELNKIADAIARRWERG